MVRRVGCYGKLTWQCPPGSAQFDDSFMWAPWLFLALPLTAVNLALLSVLPCGLARLRGRA